MKIQVRKRGKDFLLNGRPTKLRMRTSFKLFGWILQGRMDKARGWLERIKRQGFHGPRVFGETHYWGPPFFGLPPVNDPYNLNTGVGSGFKMTTRHKKALRQLVELLHEYEMVAEFSVLATLKGRNRPDRREENGHDIVGWNSHALRRTAEELFTIREQMGSLNMLFETFNEFDAHAVPIGRGELHMEAQRWKTRDLPGSLIGVSHGGRWDYDYKVGNGPQEFTHCNIHSRRDQQWWKIADDLEELRSKVKDHPIYLNENMHYMTQDQWDEWIPKVPKWARLSSTDWRRIQEQWNYAYNFGASYCVHDFTGMATDPDMPESPLEIAHREQFGDGGPPPPPPPPPPDSLTSGKLPLEASHADSLGRLTFAARYPKGVFPLLLEGGYERDAKPIAGESGGAAIDENAGVLRCRYEVELPETMDVTAIDSFHGLNRGDIVEMDTEIHDQFNRAVFHRSDHKEVHGNYDAWVHLPVRARTKKLSIGHTLRVNGKNMDPHGIIPYHGQFRAVGHFGVRIQAQQIGDNPVLPEPTPNYNEYVTSDRVQELQGRISEEMNIWAGVRDINYVLGNCSWQQLWDEGELRRTAKQYVEIIEEGERLKRNLSIPHSDTDGRSMVKKETVSEFLRRLGALNATVEGYRNDVESWPGGGSHYNSIKGWCKYCNDNNIRNK
jgi:hypothetical protein